MANGNGSEDCLSCRFVGTASGNVQCLRHGLPLPRPGYEVICTDFEDRMDGKGLEGSRFIGLREGALYYYSYAVSSHCDLLIEFEDLVSTTLCSATLKFEPLEPEWARNWTIEVRGHFPGSELTFDFGGRSCRGLRQENEKNGSLGNSADHERGPKEKIIYVFETQAPVNDWLDNGYVLRKLFSAFSSNSRLANRGVPVFLRANVRDSRPLVATVVKDVLAARMLFDA